MKDKRFKSKLSPYFTELYYLRNKHGYTYKMLSEYIRGEYNIKVTDRSVLNFLKARENKGIVPSKRSLINILRKDDGSENKISISYSKKNKTLKMEEQKPEEKTKASSNNVSKLDEIIKELGIN
ncbi:MAG: hypothetical protein GY718_06295 [Lentisphaerae bacterium]|nr:hypothetical protein [Lentisphaerota bacterium]